MPTSVSIAPGLVNKIYNLAMIGDFSAAQTHQMELANVMGQLAAIDKSKS